MNTCLLHSVLNQFPLSFLAFFGALTKRDLRAILDGEGETLITILQERYGYNRAQAKMAWNEFVLRYVDGHPTQKHFKFAALPPTLLRSI